ncbi:MAG: hypothetical protein ACD_39C01323G0001 [uncultured bacterium]|nr:MAG: hypothetical protein ACD_39C01323G0001 [uncultured bacterium]
MFRYRKPAGDDYDHYLQGLDMAARKTAGALLDTGIAVDGKDNAGRTPLYYVIQNKMWSTAHFLIKKGANPHEKGPDGISPAMLIDAADSHYLKQILGITE